MHLILQNAPFLYTFTFYRTTTNTIVRRVRCVKKNGTTAVVSTRWLSVVSENAESCSFKTAGEPQVGDHCPTIFSANRKKRPKHKLLVSIGRKVLHRLCLLFIIYMQKLQKIKNILG